MKPPDWWYHSQQSWKKLSATLSLLNIAEFDCVFFEQNWRRLETGISNHSYQLVLGEQCFFVQIPSSNNFNKLPARHFFPVNQQIQKIPAIQHWLSNCYCESKELKIYEWIDAAHLKPVDLAVPERQEELVTFLVTLHQSDCQLPVLNMQDQLYHYYQLAVTNTPLQADYLKSIYDEAIFLTTSFHPVMTCHNDLSPGNLLFNKQLFVLDWEYACIGDPLFDLAGISINFTLNDETENQLLQKYHKRIAFSHKNYTQMKLLYQLMSQLWLG